MKTHYEILGVAPTAAHKEIQSAYYKRARRWHPDNFAQAPSGKAARAERAMQRVNQAWDVLGDKNKRLSYDRSLRRAKPTERREGIRVRDGITRVDPRLVDRQVLQDRRDAQIDEVASSHAVLLRMVPVVGFVALLVAIFIFSAYAGGSPDDTEPQGPAIGVGIDLQDCVDIISGPALLERPCTATADGRVVGSRWVDSGQCPPETLTELVLANGRVACLGPLVGAG